MSSPYCEECNSVPESIFITDAGASVCSVCGLILKQASDSVDHNNNPNPVHVPAERLLKDIEWWTREASNLQDVISALKTISTMADKLGLVAKIKDRASNNFLIIGGGSSRIGMTQNRREAILLACLYIACKQEENPRTVKEIHMIANKAITLKEVYHANEFVEKKLRQHGHGGGGEVEIGRMHAGDLVTRFCSKLGMADRAMKAAVEAVKKSEELDIRRAPSTVVAAIIYIVSQLSDGDKKEVREVAVATRVSESTIKQCLKELYPQLSKIIPDWYAHLRSVRRRLLGSMTEKAK